MKFSSWGFVGAGSNPMIKAAAQGFMFKGRNILPPQENLITSARYKPITINMAATM
ncbi:MAG TPA: hypothetical protein VHP30_10880 [Ignavibacteriales bacterium]|nr:hypothetical protein [Ignavibacteriales bacterium]